jgi:hypothetical protein
MYYGGAIGLTFVLGFLALAAWGIVALLRVAL